MLIQFIERSKVEKLNLNSRPFFRKVQLQKVALKKALIKPRRLPLRSILTTMTTGLALKMKMMLGMRTALRMLSVKKTLLLMTILRNDILA